MPIDFTQFFNPAAWGSWAPGNQGFLNPAVAGAPNAPQPSGAIVGPNAPPPQIAGANAPGAPPVPGGKPIGVNPQGGGWTNMLQKAALMVQPQASAPQPIQMPKPVGPGVLPPQGYGATGMLGRMF